MLNKISVNEQNSIRIDGEKVIYFDPYQIKKESHDGDIVFITHAHRDHFSPNDYQKVAKPDTIFVVPASMEANVLEAGIRKNRLVTFKPGDDGMVLDIPVEAVPAYNIGKPMHPKTQEWVGYVITVENTRIYVCGDTDAIPEGKMVNCDIVLVPIGGFFTMNAKQAAKFVNEMKPKVAIPTHYGSVVGTPKDGRLFKDLVDPEIQVHIMLSAE